MIITRSEGFISNANRAFRFIRAVDSYYAFRNLLVERRQYSTYKTKRESFYRRVISVMARTFKYKFRRYVSNISPGLLFLIFGLRDG